MAGDQPRADEPGSCGQGPVCPVPETAPDTVCGLRRATSPASGPVRLPRGSRLATRVLSWFGWRNEFAPLPEAHGLYIVYPHTSNWDFILGLLYKWSHGMPFKFWIKDSATRLPLIGPWIRWVGGVPINRSAAYGVVEQTQHQMHASAFFWLVVAPEGTRSYTPGWRTGFYHLWRTLDCPLGLAYIDYGARQLGVTDYVRCSGDMEADFAAIARYYAGRQGCHPDQQSPIVPLERHRHGHRHGHEHPSQPQE